MDDTAEESAGDEMEKTRQRRKPLITGTNTRRRSFFWKHRSDFYDYNLVAVVVLLTCFGLIMLYSTSSYTAEIEFGDDMYYFRRQAIISLGCIIIALIISWFDYHILMYFTTLLYGAAILLMLLVRTPLGWESHGARRWLRLGPIQFQPSEIAKIAVIVCLSYMIVKMGKQVRTLKACMVLGGMGGLLALIAYVGTENLSTAIIIFCITAGMIFIAHPDTKIFLIIGGIALVVIIVGVKLLSITTNVGDENVTFRMQRILVWLHPEQYADHLGYQTLQALYAIGSGGLLGRGLGNSMQKLGKVPEAQNDMIFSIVCEELGLVGGVIVLLMFGYLLYRLFFIAQNAPDLFGSLLVSGIFIHIALQVILNVAVVLNLLPNTGVTLPFISYGGTSILFLMAEMGLALSVARQIRFQDSDLLL